MKRIVYALVLAVALLQVVIASDPIPECPPACSNCVEVLGPDGVPIEICPLPN